MPAIDPDNCGLQVLLAFQCSAGPLLDAFMDWLSEPEWQDPHTKRHQVLLDLERRLGGHGKSLGDYGIDAPVLPPPGEPDVDARYLPDAVTLNDSQRQLFHKVQAHVSGPREGPLLLHAEGEPGSGKSFVINVCLNYVRSLGAKALAAAFPAKVAQNSGEGRRSTTGRV